MKAEVRVTKRAPHHKNAKFKSSKDASFKKIGELGIGWRRDAKKRLCGV